MEKIIASFLIALSMTGCGNEASSSGFEQINAKEFWERVKTLDKNEILLDIRTPDEFRKEKIQGSQNIDYYESNFESELDKLDKSKTYYIYCRSGNRTRETMKKMEDLGFEKIYELKNGINSWVQEGYGTI